MSYANGTTHYNLPQTVGTDKRDWFDTNQAFADIDEALYGAVQESASTATALTALTTRVGAVESDVATIQTSQSTDEANIAALQTLVNQHTTEIADVKADALDMICAIDEGTAQVASIAVNEGKYFRYNDVLYMATTDIAVGDTIVPNTNCRATNVATELESIDVVDLTPRVEALESGKSNLITVEDVVIPVASFSSGACTVVVDMSKAGKTFLMFGGIFFQDTKFTVRGVRYQTANHVTLYLHADDNITADYSNQFSVRGLYVNS